MPCISSDGKPTPTGMAILRALSGGPLSPKEIADVTQRPLYRVRSGLRELEKAGFVNESDGNYRLSEKGEMTLK
ncbi:winged helix-turn-helix transcriptional regulator [Candidatus Bathyarchaeota archaeon]|nr:winged helix-turn-helix transcriptional regulator [Candidatus Bathyarchaeota archaeon]